MHLKKQKNQNQLHEKQNTVAVQTIQHNVSFNGLKNVLIFAWWLIISETYILKRENGLYLQAFNFFGCVISNNKLNNPPDSSLLGFVGGHFVGQKVITTKDVFLLKLFFFFF